MHLKDAHKILGFFSVFFPKYKISNNHLFASGLTSFILKLRTKHTFIVTNHLDINAFKVSEITDTPIIKTASIGRMYPEKRIDILVKLISSLKKSGISIEHHHAGKGILKDEIINQIKTEGVEDNFILHGDVTDISSFLSDKSFFIHTSDFEGYPNVIMEAMACGKPIVTTACGDASFLVTDGENGFVRKTGDVDGLLNACTKLIKQTDLIRKFGLKSRFIAERDFKLEHLMETTLSVYNQVLNKKGQSN